MKLAYIILGVLFSMMVQNIAFAQVSNGASEEEKKKQMQIDGYVHIIKNSSDVKEIEKAKVYLAELGVKYEETVPAQPKKMTEAEEQKKMSETLSPEEYNAWKAEKYKNTEIKPNQVLIDPKNN